ncbi:MAG: 50S ribosomal protein L9 [Chlamydiia bacterium]
MKQHRILLVKDVKNLGRSGDIVTVRPGFCRNFLLPYGHAIRATLHTEKLQTKLREERVKKAEEDRKVSDRIKSQLEQLTFVVDVRVDETGHLYGSVSVQDILNLLHQENFQEIEKGQIKLAHPIKQLGNHVVTIRLKEEVEAEMHIRVKNDEFEANLHKAAAEHEQEALEPASDDYSE